MNILRISAFSDNNSGGNPAGVVIADTHPEQVEMQRIARLVGYSETAFAHPLGEKWRVRYFSPESEVPFCGHATIALGSALAWRHGPAVFPLVLNDTEITVEGYESDGIFGAALQSPGTRSKPIDPELLSNVLHLFNYTHHDLCDAIPAALIHAGANHSVIALKSRELLSAMAYNLDQGRRLMNDAKLVTIMFVYTENPQRFHARNAFASGGVVEDPATGAASAAFAGYLNDINWPHGHKIIIVQGEDLGAKSIITARIPAQKGSSVRVSGATHLIPK